MEKPHLIQITNGTGSVELTNGNYNVTASVEGYDNASIRPLTQEITEGVNSYNFTISATGTLTLHVSDNGTPEGTAIFGATFYRCDAQGNEYGNVITSDDQGNAIFANVPFSTTGTPPTIYFKQVSSDGEHIFTQDLQNTTLDTETKTLEITNSPAPERTFTLTDANYENLPITDGNITLTSIA